jgi:AcrR family transcriptional regulator
MNTAALTSSYESPLREAQKEETRRRILDAAGVLIETVHPGGLSFGAIAKQAGIQERTVYRHFPTKDALLEALWAWLDPRIGIKSFPQTEAELTAFPARVFPAFDDNEQLMRAMWSSPQGREFRLGVNDKRKAAILKSVSAATAEMDPREAAWIAAAAQLLYSGAAWMTMKDYWGFSGAEAGKASSFVIGLLMRAARERAAETKGAGRRRKKTGETT